MAFDLVAAEHVRAGDLVIDPIDGIVVLVVAVEVGSEDVLLEYKHATTRGYVADLGEKVRRRKPLPT